MENLIGKKIIWESDESDSSPCNAVILMADNDVGYTIAEEEDESLLVTCIQGPSSPLFVTRDGGEEQREQWEKKKKYLQLAVEQGVFNVQDMQDDVYGEQVDSGSWGDIPASRCSFAQ